MTKVMLVLIVAAIAVFGIMTLLDSVEAGDGQVGESVMDSYNGIRDAASDVMDSVNSTDTITVETHDSPLPALWDWARNIAQGE